MALTPEQRSAQRRLIGLVRAGSNGSLSRECGLGWWREETDGEWKSGHEDIAEMFEVLGIPYQVSIEKRPIRGRARAVFGVYVRWGDLPAVVRWMPSFQQLIDQVETAQQLGSRRAGAVQDTVAPLTKRRNHYWLPGENAPDGPFTVRCRNCDMTETTGWFRDGKRVLAVLQWRTPAGALVAIRPVLDRRPPKAAPPLEGAFPPEVPVGGMPECPKSPEGWRTS